MRQLLIIAYYFPPLGGIGSLRVHGYATHLPAYGWQPTILTPRSGAYFRDPELSYPEERIIRTPALELSRAGKRVLRAGGSDDVAAEVDGLRFVARSAARKLLYFPDAQVGWYPPAILTARRALRGRRFDAILSSSFPITAHLIARSLHRWMKVPWIAEFRDPWSQMLAEQGRSSRRARQLETALARESVARVMTSPSWAASHAEQWRRPVEVIANGHDGQVTGERHQPDFTLAYLGSFYPRTQSLSALWEAIARLQAAPTGGRVRVQFIGTLHPDLERELERRGLRPNVEVTGFLTHVDALARLSRSSLVVAAGPHDARGLLRGQVAAKLAEYLATDRPILYIGDPDCDAAELLRGYPGTRIVATGDVDGVTRALTEERRRTYARDTSALDRRALAGSLADLLGRACASQRLGASDG
jgi:glycosyltransferase involved in cell wall biosynthesis